MQIKDVLRAYFVDEIKKISTHTWNTKWPDLEKAVTNDSDAQKLKIQMTNDVEEVFGKEYSKNPDFKSLLGIAYIKSIELNLIASDFIGTFGFNYYSIGVSLMDFFD